MSLVAHVTLLSITQAGQAAELRVRAVVLPPEGSPYRPPAECYLGIRVDVTVFSTVGYPATHPETLPRVTLRTNAIHHVDITGSELRPGFYSRAGCASDGAYSAVAQHGGGPECPQPSGTVGAVLWHLVHSMLTPSIERPLGSPELRFAVGDMVEANVGAWASATVVAVWDHADEAPALQPYRLRIDSAMSNQADQDQEPGEPTEVWAPDDTDAYVRAPPGSALEARASRPNAERAAHVWWDLADATSHRWDVVAAYARGGHALHPELFHPPIVPVESIAFWSTRLAPAVAKWLVAGADAATLTELVSVECPNVSSFELFSRGFCEELLNEIEHYEAVAVERRWPVRRPNSMNAHGAILNEIGLEALAGSLQDTVLTPLAAALFAPQGSELMTHHTFMVSYEPGLDLGLDMHTDDSDGELRVACLCTLHLRG